MKYKYTLLLVLCFNVIYGQYHETVFPELEGNNLKNALVSEYKTSSVLSYSQARDTFFRSIDAVDNVLECVYTGYKITLNPALDPTTDAFEQGINTEHTYPRSKGALEGTNAYSDMHHLFPTRERVNSDRGSFPFQEINDNQTDKWYFEANTLTNIPSSNIDSYSEFLKNKGFEPREKHKGDVARAYFYFYTMYKALADQEAPFYFSNQQETMCNWHFQDPVDEKEWNRNIKIAKYQDDKKNPFILDCRLARLYCDDIMGTCLSVSTDDVERVSISISPNPTTDRIYINMEKTTSAVYRIVGIAGNMKRAGFVEFEDKGASIYVDGLVAGFYVLQVLNEKGEMIGATKFVKI